MVAGLKKVLRAVVADQPARVTRIGNEALVVDYQAHDRTGATGVGGLLGQRLLDELLLGLEESLADGLSGVSQKASLAEYVLVKVLLQELAAPHAPVSVKHPKELAADLLQAVPAADIGDDTDSVLIVFPDQPPEGIAGVEGEVGAIPHEEPGHGIALGHVGQGPGRGLAVPVPLRLLLAGGPAQVLAQQASGQGGVGRAVLVGGQEYSFIHCQLVAGVAGVNAMIEKYLLKSGWSVWENYKSDQAKSRQSYEAKLVLSFGSL
jgi:hypothetical protein